MSLGRSTARILLAASLLAAMLLAAQPAARAAFHLMEVKEVFAGTSAQANADFVELRMQVPDQNLIGGHKLYLYAPPDIYGEATRHECTIPSNVTANTAADARILFATVEAQMLFGPADFTIPQFLGGNGGAVCFENIDCVSWGSFTGATTSPAGTPEPGGITPDQSIHRTAADTNDSATDFQVDSPNPMPNSAAPNAQPCATGTPGGNPVLRGLKAKVKGGRATITGTIQPPASGDNVKLTLFANGSPLTKVAKKSATLNADSKFRKSFRVPSDSTRCRVKVAFKGAPVGKKTFRC